MHVHYGVVSVCDEIVWVLHMFDRVCYRLGWIGHIAAWIVCNEVDFVLNEVVDSVYNGMDRVKNAVMWA